MYNHNFIDEFTYNNAKKIEVKDMLNTISNTKDTSYSYQSYIDVLYKQIYEKTGYDIYLTPMEVYTYMDSALQKEIDNMQNGTLTIKNKHQQFASTIIDNNTGSIKAIFGGKNYNGQRLVNKAYDVLFQPASTIKIPLCYALAFEYLNYSSKKTLLDEPINGLDTDGMKIMREVLVDITQNHNCTILIASHILGELEKIATHYGIIRHGKMIKEMTADEFIKECRTFIALKSKDIKETKEYNKVKNEIDKILLTLKKESEKL